MNLFDVYPLFDITPIRGQGHFVYDQKNQEYLDLYGGHAVISIGHAHPYYVKKIQEQVARIGFYSNSVQNPLQQELASQLGVLSGYDDYSLFLVNSGAEAMENALKVASFHTGREKVVVFERGFHGRTSAAVAITDNPKIQAPLNHRAHVIRLPWLDLEGLQTAMQGQDICAVVIEGIQGIGGIHVPTENEWKQIRTLCDQHGTMLIADEIQSGYGRSGKFFAHQYGDIRADVITMAKGMGNGFPIGGILISPEVESWYGMLGTTFGGNHLACAAGIAVLEVILQENLMKEAKENGEYLMEELRKLETIVEVRGLGLMIGIELPEAAKPIRQKLLDDYKIFTGSSSQPNVLRILPPLNVPREELDRFIKALRESV